MGKKFDVVAEFGDAESERRVWESNWQDIADLFMPNESDFDRIRVKGGNRAAKIYDPIGMHALELAAAGLYSRATNPASKWFRLKAVKDGEPDLMDNQEVQVYLEKRRSINQETISTKLAAQMYLNYRHLLAFGFTNLYIEEDDEDVLFGRVFPLRDIFFMEDHRGKVNTIFRRFNLKGRQAERHFSKKGDSVPAEMAKKWAENPELEYTFIHGVFPRDVENPKSKLPKDKPFASEWHCTEGKVLLRSGGFETFPYVTPRLDLVAGEVFGRGPGATAMPAVSSANKLQELLLDAGNMAIRPPLDVPQEAYTTPLRMTPAALNYNQDEQGRKATPISSFQGDININFTIIQELHATVRQIFFNDQLQLINGPQMTATEVLERSQQNMFLLGPWHGRLEDEYLRPLIERVDSINDNKNKFPDAPEILQGAEIKIEYDSPLALAQKQEDVRAIDEAVGSASQIQQTTGTPVLDNIKLDEAYRRRAKFKGLTSDLLFSTEEVQAGREQRAQAAAAAAQAEAAQGLIDGAQGLAALPGGDEIVRRELEGVAGAGEEEA